MVICPNFRTVIARNTLAYKPSKYTILGLGSKTCKPINVHVHDSFQSAILVVLFLSCFCMKDSTCCGVYSTLSFFSIFSVASLCLCYAFMYLSPLIVWHSLYNKTVFTGSLKCPRCPLFTHEFINYIFFSLFVPPKPLRGQGTWRLFWKSWISD